MVWISNSRRVTSRREVVEYSDHNKFPYIPLRWTAISGENYGRGLVEQYLGDFRSLEGLYQLLIESSSCTS